ncbi:hypothetical protein RMSM_07493 [Rhodopirellula maiorica SM1]|uniref:Class I SAM-dependent methyltransferase n=2 Tax=Novipirellula TaxID=2795426 RepID=M5R949_9BACT|nr:hypothetical protein RMSM_07493 [Rhodopirellula maiorica SM1]
MAKNHVSSVSRGKVVWVKDISPNAASPKWVPPEKEFDFIFVDGDHSYEAVRIDFDTWVPRLAQKAIMAFHDSYGRNNAGSERFVNEVVTNDNRFRLVERIDSLSVFEFS